MLVFKAVIVVLTLAGQPLVTMTAKQHFTSREACIEGARKLADKAHAALKGKAAFKIKCEPIGSAI